MKSSPCSLQLEKACAQQQRPNAAKNKFKKKIDIQHISWRCTAKWFDLHTSWNYQNKFSEHQSSHTDKKLKK